MSNHGMGKDRMDNSHIDTVHSGRAREGTTLPLASHLLWALLSAGSLMILLSGCIESSGGGGGSSDSGAGEALPDRDAIQTVVIDVTDPEQTRYLNLATGTVAESEPEQWHLAFSGRQIRTDTAQEVHGFLGTDAPSELLDSDGAPNLEALRNAAADDYIDLLIDSFAEIDAAIRPAISGDVPRDEPGDFFYQLDMSSMPPRLIHNDSVGWLIRGRNGETYARLRATDIYFDMGGSEGFRYTFTMDLQPRGAGGFESHSHAAGIEFSGELKRHRRDQRCFNFSTYDAQEHQPGAAECSGTAWDLKIFRDPTARMGEDLTLLINGGFDRNGAPRPGAAAVIGSLPWSELASKHSAEEVPGYPDPDAWLQDRVESIAADDWFVEISSEDLPSGEARTIWPTYRVYVIDTDALDPLAPRYAFQVIGYYDSNGTAGIITARYVELPNDAR
ncbi:HmuY family protein [Halorhodospira abdelmalekii]|uniref:HmuY family protein n=1 Tax=Halorhodospira abdelmalekii TaxID=421629 RepID=UPI001904E36F|nr:HmuY family protein [Halorhodospira abdelmalekii]